MNHKKDKIKILIVEDEAIVAKDISETLSEIGYEVVGYAISGKETIEKCKSAKPDLIIMDIMLKGSNDGIETAEIIRREMDIPIIYLTAYSGDKIVERAKVTKPYGYIIKPYEKTSLYITIEIALYKHKFERDLIEKTENALATIIGCTELLLEEAEKNLHNEKIKKIRIIKKSAEIIKGVIEKL